MIGGVPVLYTLNGKVVYDLSPTDRVWLVNVSGVDEIRLGLTDDTDLEEELASKTPLVIGVVLALLPITNPTSTALGSRRMASSTACRTS